MSANAENTTPQQPVNKKKGKRKRALLLLTLLFIIIAVAYGIYWFLVLRHTEETDDAYVAGNQVQIMAQVSGSVTKVWADNTDFVQKGDVLVTLDPTDAQQAFEKAQTELASSVRQTRQLMINSKQLQASINVQKTALAQAQTDFNRRVPLGNANLIGREELQHARDAVASAQAQLDVSVQQYNANQAMVLDTTLDQQPAVKQAATEVRNAWLALQRTKIVSPMTGYVSRRSVQPGAQISSSTPLMAVVPATNLWVDANFKETQLAHMRIGQSATIVSDIYGDEVKYTGKVVGLDMGTGSASPCCLRRTPPGTGSKWYSVCRCVSSWMRNSWRIIRCVLASPHWSRSIPRTATVRCWRTRRVLIRLTKVMPARSALSL